MFYRVILLIFTNNFYYENSFEINDKAMVPYFLFFHSVKYKVK